MKTEDELLLSYVAGLFDGEGSVSASLQGEKRHVRLSVRLGMADPQGTPEPIQRLVEMFGGEVTVKAYRTASKRENKMHTWGPPVRGKGRTRFLTAILPYVLLKRVVVAAGAKLSASLDSTREAPYPKQSIHWSVQEEREALVEVIRRANARPRSRLAGDAWTPDGEEAAPLTQTNRPKKEKKPFVLFTLGGRVEM
jgi:hypothetical protein